MPDHPDNAPDDARPYFWTTDEAVLVHIVRQLEHEGREMVDLAAIRAAVGLGDEESHRVIGRLERDGMIEVAGIGARGMRQGIYVVKAVTGRGLRRAGAWPTEAEMLAEQIMAAFTEAADRESDPAQRSKLSAVVSSFREVGKKTAIEVMASYFAKMSGA